MNPLARRNVCPTIARPILTGDGLLARLPPVGPLSGEAIRAVCDAARTFGNGIVEITARGSIQVRGLAESATAPFVEALAAVGIVDAQPAILAGPLSGLDQDEVMDVRPLVRAIRDAVETERIGTRLAPKTSIVLDGGGSLHLDAIDADLRLVATGAARFTLIVGGTAATGKLVGTVSAGDAVSTALILLRMIADAGPSARGRDLDPAAVLAAIGAHATNPPPRRPPARPVGVHALRDGRFALGVGLPFGQTDTATLAALVDTSTDGGAAAFVPAEGRTLLAIGIARERVAGCRERAAELGFVVRSDDPRRAVVACAGAPACAAGMMPARAVAPAVAAEAAPILDGSVTVHVSGCAKGCAHPRAAALTFVGSEHGARLVIAGRADSATAVGLTDGDLPAAVARLAASVGAARRPGETAAEVIDRLGADGVAAAIAREPADA
ncbi:MAG TPA: precorrin-3B synthase [Bauldia sp.]|nr:precorrin-3B synthase [Bauldia sp.]